MHTGMLWFNNDKSLTLEQKVSQAVEYYEKKYGRKPDLCLIHPSMMSESRELKMDVLTVRPYRPVLPGHLWLGIDKE